MSSDRAVRATRRARRSSLPARVISGASLDVSLALESDDDDFFGDDFDSDAESVPLSGPASQTPGLIQRIAIAVVRVMMFLATVITPARRQSLRLRPRMTRS